MRHDKTGKQIIRQDSLKAVDFSEFIDNNVNNFEVDFSENANNTIQNETIEDIEQYGDFNFEKEDLFSFDFDF
jgi:hypothetical protein